MFPTTERNEVLQQGIDLDLFEAINPHKRVIIIDDEPDTVGLVKRVLMNAGIDVASAYNGSDALNRIKSSYPDLILLDLMIPDKDGWQLFEELRKNTSIPIFFISALNDVEEVVRGLELGADDYIAKPFYPSELVARINRTIRGHRDLHPMQVFRFQAEDLVIDCNTHEVEQNGRVIILPPREFGVLVSLARRPGQWVNHHIIALDVWNDSGMRVQQRIKYLVFLLRSQLEKNPGNPRLILNRDGLGYKLAVSPIIDSTENGINKTVSIS
jgi:DNA-binding response OmpR family regulator